MALKDDRVEQSLRSCGSEFQMRGPKQEKVRKPRCLAFVLLDMVAFSLLEQIRCDLVTHESK